MKKPPAGHCDLSTPCPVCGAERLVLRWWLEAKPIGTFSLAGAQLKFSARENATVQCRACEMVIPGEISADADVVDGHFVSGSFDATGRIIK